MLSACIMLGALLVIVGAITTAWGDSTADYKRHISLFGNGDDR
jgi:archaellum component FlaF (FlaF/FlaG flagellin family)